jgi:hypothetical protein
MKRLIDVFLNDIALTSVHDKIIAVRVHEQPQADELSFETAGILPGQRVLSKKRTGLNLTVFLKVRELYDMNVRMDVINAVNAWAAKGGTLKVSYRGNQTLNVVLYQPASPGDIRDYNTELELVFAADGWPYWKAEMAREHLLSRTNESKLIEIEGNAPALVDAVVYVNTTLNSISIVVGESMIEIVNLNLPAGARIKIEHDQNGIMNLTHNGKSIYAMLSDTSGDCLITSGGSEYVSIATSSSVDVQLTVHGRYL